MLYDGLSFYITKFEEVQVERPVLGSDEIEMKTLTVVTLYNDQSLSEESQKL